jgi:uncharacterized membrane protein YraQ (UPF0718 family)/zinc transporter ZupT
VDFSAAQIACSLFVVSCAGALLPLYKRWSDRGLHAFVAVTAGIFLGTIFLHLLPDLAGVDVGGGHARVGPASEPPALMPWVAALAGLLILFAIERAWIPSWSRGDARDPHTGLWAATFVGLSLHTATEGVAFAAIPGPSISLLLSVLLHKATESFSLATVMRLANLSPARSIVLLLLFALIEPAGFLAGGSLVGLGAGTGQILIGFACGTFLYVAVCDLLPEVFHGTQRPALKLLAVVAGIGVSAASLPGATVASEFAERVLRASAEIFVELAPFLLLGFTIAGILSQVLRIERLTARMRGNDFKSVLLASLVGAPLPLCSCSVVPVAVSMRRGGASKGATSAFLISTPETGVDSMTVTWALLGPLMTVARPIGAIVSALFTGLSVNFFVQRGWDRERAPAPVAAAPSTAAEAACCRHPVEPPPAHSASEATEGHGHLPAETRPGPWLVRVLRYAFVDLLDDLSVSLLIGTLLSGAIAVLVPTEVFESPAMHGIGGMLLMLAIGIPLYVCAAASTPIAATLILKGMSPGAAFVFLLASPATNLGSLIVLRKYLGTRCVIVHVCALAVVTLLLGLAIDGLYTWLELTPQATAGAVHQHSSALGNTCAVLLAILMLISLVRTHFARDLLAKLRVQSPLSSSSSPRTP